MSFTFTDDTGATIQEIYSCTECIYISTKKHFRSGEHCPLCYSPATQINTQTSTQGISSFKYRQLLDHLEENTTGVGESTRTRITEHFDSGQHFLDATEHAYKDGNYDTLTSITGVGTSTAQNIACGIAEHEGWENGLAESSFTLRKS